MIKTVGGQWAVLFCPSRLKLSKQGAHWINGIHVRGAMVPVEYKRAKL
jgi:hypothetical protein